MGWVHYVGRGPSRAKLLCGDTPAWIANNARGAYIARVLLSCPVWVDLAAVRAFGVEARRLTAETGELHVVDHIVPLSHPRVCGLSVPWNLRVIPWRVNGAKSNNWCPEQIELF